MATSKANDPLVPHCSRMLRAEEHIIRKRVCSWPRLVRGTPMPRRFICRQNHEWEASLGPDQVGLGLACPVCGATDFTCLQEEPVTRESQVDDSRAMPVPPLPALGLYFPRLPGYDIVAELGHGGMGVV